MHSPEYEANIYPPPGVTRITRAEVMYSLTAPDSKDGGVITLPMGNEFSQEDHVLNEVRLLTAPIATLEPNYWRLDGTFALPSPDVQPDVEIGWWSDDMSDADGYFSEPLAIERVFDNIQTFNTVGLTFDTATGDCFADFDVYLYGVNDNLIYRESITGNNEVYRRTESAGEGIIRVLIILLRTNKPYRYARITEIDFGLHIKYTDLDIKSINMIREADIAGKAFPIPEFRLKIVNDGAYDPLDADTYAPYFQTRQRFEYRHGLVLPDGQTEWVDCGTFYLKKWSITDKEVDFTASGKTGITEANLFLDSSLQEFTISQLVKQHVPNAIIDIESPRITGYFGIITNRKLITYLSELSCCLTYEDAGNRIVFFDTSDEKPAVDSINYANMRSRPITSIDEYYNAIELAEYVMTTEESNISSTRHAAGSVVIYFNAPIISVSEIQLTPGFILTDVNIRTMFMTGILIGNGEAEINVFGEIARFAKKSTIYRAPWHSGREPTNAYNIDLPCMIITQNYEAFRDWFLERRFNMLSKRMACDISWRQNPARDVGDIVTTQLTKNNSIENMLIVKHEIIYNSALRGNTKTISNIVMRHKIDNANIAEDGNV